MQRGTVFDWTASIWIAAAAVAGAACGATYPSGGPIFLGFVGVALLSAVAGAAVLQKRVSDRVGEAQRQGAEARAKLSAAQAELTAAQENLRRNIAQIRVLVDTSVDGIVVITTQGIVEAFSGGAERMFGYSADEVIGNNVSMLMPTPHRQEHDGHLDRYLKTGERRIIGIGREVTALKKDGSVFPVSLFVGETAGPDDRKFTGILRDLTNFRHAEERIREQASLLDRVHEAILATDLEDRILLWNQGAERIYGWKAEEVLGREIIGLLFRKMPADYAHAVEELLESGEWSGEFHQVRRDGSALIVESHWSLLTDEKGYPRGRVVINIDATERKKLELQFRRAQRLESIGTLASGIAHDLNNVLTPILMAVKLLRKDRPAEERDALLSAAQSSVERGAALVKQLLSFAGGIEGERIRVDLRLVVQEVQSLLEHTLPKTIDLQVRTPEDLWPILGDMTQLSQVIMNLSVNARDAMLQGGCLTIAAENTLLNGTAAAVAPDAKPGPYVLLQVSDTGVGIPQANLDKVFDPFFTTKELGKGTGLGLSTVAGIVKSHGGFLNIYSEEGKGTRVNVFFPMMESGKEARLAAAKVAPTAKEGAGQCILVVDDEEAIRRTALLALKSHGYAPLAASSGEEAIRVFKEKGSTIDAILLDMMMPGMDGMATMRSIRELAPDARIVATSGLHAKGRRTDAIAGGARVFLQKPYSDERLLAALQEALADH